MLSHASVNPTHPNMFIHSQILLESKGKTLLQIVKASASYVSVLLAMY